MSQRVLYELVTRDGCSISPFVWRIKYALAAKEIDYESCGLGFIDIPEIEEGRFATVPVLQDDRTYVADSWTIADYLDKAYPQLPLLFSTPTERAMVCFFDEWVGNSIRPLLFRICAKDIYDRIRPTDQAYFRESRENRLGETLEVAVADREKLVPPFRAALQPMRTALAASAFLGGRTANYADFIGFGTLIWAGSVATLDLLSSDDPLLEWLDRGLNLFGGIGRSLTLPALPIAA